MTLDTAAIGKDLDLIDLVEAIGSKPAKRKARAQRRHIMAAIRQANIAEGLDTLTDEELLAELSA